jgi:hypothetical protein
MLQRPLKHIGKDFHILVTVGREAAARADYILVDDPQGGKPHVVGIVVVAKGKAMAAI